MILLYLYVELIYFSDWSQILWVHKLHHQMALTKSRALVPTLADLYSSFWDHLPRNTLPTCNLQSWEYCQPPSVLKTAQDLQCKPCVRTGSKCLCARPSQFNDNNKVFVAFYIRSTFFARFSVGAIHQMTAVFSIWTLYFELGNTRNGVRSLKFSNETS